MIGSAREGTERHRRELGGDDLDWLRSLPYVYETDGFAVAHANFVNPHFMDYIHDRFEARDSMTSREERMLFVGHTQGLCGRYEGEVHSCPAMGGRTGIFLRML